MRCRSAGGVRRRRDCWEVLMVDLRKDRLRLVWCHDHTHHKVYNYQKKARSTDFSRNTHQTSTKPVLTPPPCPRSRVISCHFQQGRPSYNQISMFHVHKNRQKQNQPRSRLVLAQLTKSLPKLLRGSHRVLETGPL